MANLTADRNTVLKELPTYGQVKMAAGKTGRVGGMCLVDANGRYNVDAPVRCLGVVTDPPPAQNYDNASGGNDAKALNYRYSVAAPFTASATHPPTAAHVDRMGYAQDDQTISYDPADGPAAGPIRAVDADGVWVDFTPAADPLTQDADFLLAATQTLGAATAIVLATGRQVIPIKSTGGAVTRTVGLPDAADHPGRTIILEGDPDASSAVLSFPAGLNLLLVDGQTWEATANSNLVLHSNGTNWTERSRANGLA